MTKKILRLTMAGLAACTWFAGSAIAGNGIGNQPMKGAFNLQIIAYDKNHCPAGDFTDSSRHQIAVEADFGTITCDQNNENCTTSNQHGNPLSTLNKNNTIGLMSSGVDGGFWVEDGNACGSKGGAKLHLPISTANCAGDCPIDGPTFTEYTVWVRLVGKPNTGIGVTTCGVETEDDVIIIDDDAIDEEQQIICSTESYVKIRETGHGKMKFEDATTELLTLCLDTLIDDNLDGSCDERIPLFDVTLQDYFWQWNTKGKAHAQVRFIPVISQ
jgi:hypothetical protein